MSLKKALWTDSVHSVWLAVSHTRSESKEALPLVFDNSASTEEHIVATASIALKLVNNASL